MAGCAVITRLFTYRHHNGLRASVVALRCASEAASLTEEFRAAGEQLAMSVAATDVDEDTPIADQWCVSDGDGDLTIGARLEQLARLLRERVGMTAYRYRVRPAGKGLWVAQWIAE